MTEAEQLRLECLRLAIEAGGHEGAIERARQYETYVGGIASSSAAVDGLTPKQKREAIREALLNGEKHSSIAKRLGCGLSFVLRVRRQSGIPPRRNYSPEQRERMVAHAARMRQARAAAE